MQNDEGQMIEFYSKNLNKVNCLLNRNEFLRFDLIFIEMLRVLTNQRQFSTIKS